MFQACCAEASMMEWGGISACEGKCSIGKRSAGGLGFACRTCTVCRRNGMCVRVCAERACAARMDPVIQVQACTAAPPH